MDIDSLISAIAEFIINPIIILLFVVALAVFFWGIFEFIRDAGSETGRETGKQHILWGVIGIFIMVSVFAIIRIILGTFGIPEPPNLPLP